MKKASNVIIGILIVLGLLLQVVPNGVRFSGYLLLWGAALLVLWRILSRWAERSKAGRVLRRIYAAGIAGVLILLAVLEIRIVTYGEADASGTPVDAVIVLGAGVNGETPSAALWSRIRAAAEYLQSHPEVPVVLSGGQGPGEDISEAEAMGRALREKAEDNPLLLEDQSRNTAENFRNSKALLEANGVNTETALIAVVTNDFHCFRAHMIAQKNGLQTIDVPAELPWWWLTANYYIREAFAVVKTAVFD